jgi:hypothetical protein
MKEAQSLTVKSTRFLQASSPVLQQTQQHPARLVSRKLTVQPNCLCAVQHEAALGYSGHERCRTQSRQSGPRRLWKVTQSRQSGPRRLWKVTQSRQSGPRRLWKVTQSRQSGPRRLWKVTQCLMKPHAAASPSLRGVFQITRFTVPFIFDFIDL